MRKAIILAGLLLATPAVAQDQAMVCQVSGGFVEQAVQARLDGLTQKEAQALIKDGITENKLMWSLVLGPLVSQVYDLPEEKMTEDFDEKFVEACLAQ